MPRPRKPGPRKIGRSLPQGNERWTIRIAGQTMEGGSYGPVALVRAQERTLRFEPADHNVIADVLVKHEFGPPEVVYRVTRRDGVLYTNTVQQLD